MTPDFKAFALDVMERWPEAGLDGFELHDLAEKHGLIAQCPGGYDRAAHGPDHTGAAQPGDDWFLRTYSDGREGD